MILPGSRFPDLKTPKSDGASLPFFCHTLDAFGILVIFPIIYGWSICIFFPSMISYQRSIRPTDCSTCPRIVSMSFFYAVIWFIPTLIFCAFFADLFTPVFIPICSFFNSRVPVFPYSISCGTIEKGKPVNSDRHEIEIFKTEAYGLLVDFYFVLWNRLPGFESGVLTWILGGFRLCWTGLGWAVWLTLLFIWNKSWFAFGYCEMIPIMICGMLVLLHWFGFGGCFWGHTMIADACSCWIYGNQSHVFFKISSTLDQLWSLCILLLLKDTGRWPVYLAI